MGHITPMQLTRSSSALRDAVVKERPVLPEQQFTDGDLQRCGELLILPGATGPL